MVTLTEIQTDPFGPRCTGITDDDIDTMAREELGKIKSRVQAGSRRAVLWFAPFRKPGNIEVPWDFTGNSVEAVVVDDQTGLELPKGTRVMAHPDEGIYYTVDGVRLCFVERESLLLAVEA